MAPASSISVVQTWGECRLRACQPLGWTEIEVTVREVDPVVRRTCVCVCVCAEFTESS